MFVGFDLSLTGTGIVSIDSNYKIVDKIRLSVPQKGIERLFHLENMFLDFIEKVDYKSKIKLCFIESPAYGVSEGNLFNIGEINGIFKLNLFKRGNTFLFAAPTQVKKYCVGKGKGNKDLILLKTYQAFGEEFDSSDLADAYILSRISRDYYYMFLDLSESKIKDIKKYQIEVLKKIHKTEEEKNMGELIK